MSLKVTTATQRLNSILPLKAGLEALNNSSRQLYLATLRSYLEQGRPLNRVEMTTYVDDINATIITLKQNNLVVFDDNGEPIGAYPFTMEPRKHQVTVNNQTVHCMCALDALAVSPMFNLQTHISSSCEVTASPIAILQQGMEIIDGDQELFFGIDWNAASTEVCCADSLCTEMIFLASNKVAEKWLAEDTDNREIFNLQEAVEFAAAFFVPLVDDN